MISRMLGCACNLHLVSSLAERARLAKSDLQSMGLREWEWEWELGLHLSGRLDLRRTENGKGLVRWVHVDSTQRKVNAGPVFARALRDPGTIMERYR